LLSYLPWSNGDLESVERALQRYRMTGLEANFNLDRSEEGIVTISQIDARIVDAPLVMFEIHKLGRADTSGRPHWVVQIQSIDGKTQVLKQHGCVASSILVFAIAKAEKDLKDGLVNTDSFDLAANFYWLK
jgi:hypothetical protein